MVQHKYTDFIPFSQFFGGLQFKRYLDVSEYVLIYQADVKTTHAVYVQCYNSVIKIVTCMNSMGQEDELPRIELNKVQRLYKVTCTAIEDNNIGNIM